MGKYFFVPRIESKKGEEETPLESTKSTKSSQSIRFRGDDDEDEPDGFFDVSTGKFISRDEFFRITHHQRAFFKKGKEDSEDDDL